MTIARNVDISANGFRGEILGPVIAEPENLTAVARGRDDIQVAIPVQVECDLCREETGSRRHDDDSIGRSTVNRVGEALEAIDCPQHGGHEVLVEEGLERGRIGRAAATATSVPSAVSGRFVVAA